MARSVFPRETAKRCCSSAVLCASSAKSRSAMAACSCARARSSSSTSASDSAEPAAAFFSNFFSNCARRSSSSVWCIALSSAYCISSALSRRPVLTQSATTSDFGTLAKSGPPPPPPLPPNGVGGALTGSGSKLPEDSRRRTGVGVALATRSTLSTAASSTARLCASPFRTCCIARQVARAAKLRDALRAALWPRVKAPRACKLSQPPRPRLLSKLTAAERNDGDRPPHPLWL
mmetsp:Transcript_33347/g.78316  ORF Transcript_33347/g.78316 Transcript_33347/m.78316 type:complete len:233 (-) Transcript_33347:2-700(-)